MIKCYKILPEKCLYNNINISLYSKQNHSSDLILKLNDISNIILTSSLCIVIDIDKQIILAIIELFDKTFQPRYLSAKYLPKLIHNDEFDNKIIILLQT